MKRILVILWLVSGLFATAQPPVEFVHVTDSHVMKLAGVQPKLVAAREHYSESAGVLARVLEQLGRPPVPSFVLHTGDIVDAYCFDGPGERPVYGQLEVVKTVLDRSPVPVFLALGNHDIQRYRVSEKGAAGDLSVAADARREWWRMFPVLRGDTYYSFRKQVGATTYRFLILDNGESESRNPKFYSQQLRWMRGQVEEGDHDVIVLAMHIPLGDNSLSKSIMQVAAGGNTVLSIAGHRHTDAVEELDLGGRAFAQVRTAILATDETHTRRFRLFEDRIEISETGHPDHVLKTVPVQRAAAVSGRVIPKALPLPSSPHASQ